MGTLEQEQWEALLKVLDAKSQDNTLLREFREDQLILNNTVVNRMDHTDKTIERLIQAIEKQSFDISKVVSNHNTEINRVRKDIEDANMERRDCKVDLHEDINKLDRHISNNYPSNTQLKVYTLIASSVAAAVLSGSLWLSSNVMMRGTASVNDRLKTDMTALFEQHKRDLMGLTKR